MGAMDVVTRFAPSPTGFMHIGGVRTALFAYLWAQKNGGVFILRIEDTDKDREVEGSTKHIEDALSWAGIEWNYGPENPGPFGSCIQSERLETYRAYAQKLIDKGLAYPDPYTKEDVEKFRAEAQEKKEPFLYRNHRPETFGKWDGTKPLRFKVPEIKRYGWVDAVRGNLEAGEEALDDFILIKSDGFPTYNFAHIIDDHEMGVTHIFRADEFISSTPRFLSLYEALEIEHPVFVTLPPILREDRSKKLGKRDGAKDVLEYQEEGFLPEAFINYLAFIGWNPGTEEEIFSKAELIERFSLDQIQNGGAAFNEEKLRWVNREHLRNIPPEEFSNGVRKFMSPELGSALEKTGRFEKLLPEIKERIETYGDIRVMEKNGEFAYFAEAPQYDVEKLNWKNDPEPANTKKHLEHVATLLGPLEASKWASETVKNALWSYAEQEGKGNVLWPLRYALSGQDKSPDPFSLADILGKDETLQRIQSAVKLLS